MTAIAVLLATWRVFPLSLLGMLLLIPLTLLPSLVVTAIVYGAPGQRCFAVGFGTSFAFFLWYLAGARSGGVAWFAAVFLFGLPISTLAGWLSLRFRQWLASPGAPGG